MSGYQLLWRWLDHRKGQQMDIEFYRALQDVAARIADLRALLAQADDILSQTLDEPVTANQLFASAGAPTSVATSARFHEGEHS